MSPSARFGVFSVIASCCVVALISPSPAESQLPQHSPNAAADSQARTELAGLLAGLLSDSSAHMRMGPTRMATSTDSARAAAIVLAARAALSQYVDVNVAERDGYYRNLPWLEDQPIYHYNSALNFRGAGKGAFDPSKPVSLLYKKDDQRQLRLVGAMYATGASATAEDLDALLPVSMAHWHEHVNVCYPGSAVGRSATQAVDARMVFWVKFYFSITTASECETARGQFVPVEFGWMAHVYLFAGSDDPKVIWDTDDVGNMDVHMRHP